MEMVNKNSSSFSPVKLSIISESTSINSMDPIKDRVGIYERDEGYMVGINRGAAVRQRNLSDPTQEGWREAVRQYKDIAEEHKVMVRCRGCNKSFPTYSLNNSLYCEECLA